MSPIQKAQEIANAQSVLGVGPNTSETDLRRAWKKLAFKMHPDRGMGTDADLANINAAYSLLRDKRVLSRQVNQTRPVEPERRTVDPSARVVRPTRPAELKERGRFQTRHADVSAEVETICRAAIGVSDVPAHVPHRIERQGRQMTFVVATPLVEGMNRVALPQSAVATSEVQPQVLTFRASAGGKGTLNVPEGMVARLYPGTSIVRIAFGRG